MAFPPLSVGAVHVKSTEVFPWLAAKFVGASGIVLGVADTEGVYEFFNEDEVEYAATPEEWREKVKYDIKNVDKQLPFIEKIQKRIREEYNYYNTWENILNSVS